MPRLTVELSRIQDPVLQDVLQSIKDYLADLPMNLADWEFFEVVFTQAETNKKIPHKLKFIPQDVIQTAKLGSGAVTFNYSLFNNTTIDITTTGACTVRFYLGSCKIGGNF